MKEEISFIDLENDELNARRSLPGAFAVGTTSGGSDSNLAFSSSTQMELQATSFPDIEDDFKCIDDLWREGPETSESGGHLAEAVAVEEVQEMPAAHR